MRVISFCFLLLFALFGCNTEQQAPSWFADTGKPKILSTTAMIGNLVEKIGKDRIDHFTLIVGEIDPHSYELVKGDDEKITCAQIVIGSGLNLEHGASLRQQLQKHPNVVFLGEEIQKRVPNQILEVGGEIDPHVWMDISLWAEGVDAIVEALAKIDRENALFYRQNGDCLRQEMLLMHRTLQKEMRKIPDEKRYLVTSHDAFRYFVRSYVAQDEDWEERCVAPEGLAPEGQLSSHDIKRVVLHLSQYNIGVIFPESNMSQDALKKIASCCSHPVRCCDQPLYGDAMGTNTYLEMIEHNIHVLQDEWNK